MKIIYTAMITRAILKEEEVFRNAKSNRLLHCASSALGITAVRTILNSTNTLTTATKMAQILKLIGLRYLGYLGAAIATYNFIKCINN